MADTQLIFLEDLTINECVCTNSARFSFRCVYIQELEVSLLYYNLRFMVTVAWERERQTCT